MTEALKVGYPYLAYRRKVWKQIVRYVVKDAPLAQNVLELGGGYCDFINQFPAFCKAVFEINPNMRDHCAPEVTFRAESAIDLVDVKDSSLDLVFAGNFLEHLTQDELARQLKRIHQTLKPEGRFVILQPNYRLCAENYFDDPTHRTIFSDENLQSLVSPHGFHVSKLIPGFLPFSLKSRLPKWGFLVRLYLASPIKPFAAQMYAVLSKI
jgi:SAM-dependent methyltransferase